MGHAVVLTGMGATSARLADPGDGREHVAPARDVVFGIAARKSTLPSDYLIATTRRPAVRA